MYIIKRGLKIFERFNNPPLNKGGSDFFWRGFLLSIRMYMKSSKIGEDRTPIRVSKSNNFLLAGDNPIDHILF